MRGMRLALVQQVVRTCFCDCLTKCIARATRTNHKTTASLFSCIVGQVLSFKKRIRTLVHEPDPKNWVIGIIRGDLSSLCFLRSTINIELENA